MDTHRPEFQAALRDHAKSLDVDPDTESFLLNLVQEALLAEVPDGWEQGETEDGTLYYFNTTTEESIWEHPLDAHYRDLIKQKKADAAKPKPAAQAPPSADKSPVQEPVKTAEVSKLEVYSFDDDSEDDMVKPLAKLQPSATFSTASERSSRLSALFDPKPAPSFSTTSSTITSSLSSTGTNKPVTSSASTASTAGTGFGRDRSWLLDNDDDVVAIPTSASASSGASSTRPSTATALSSLKSSTEHEPTTLRPSTATAFTGTSAATSSYTSRLFGTASSSSTATPTPSTATTTPFSTVDTSSSSLSTPDKISPRRGIASTIKDRFFDDLTPSTPGTFTATRPSTLVSSSSSSTASTASTASTLADVQTIRDLEKKISELTTQLDNTTRDSESRRQQLESARAEAQEASYLKMKAKEHKTKLSAKEAECTRLQTEVTRLQDECSALQQVQTMRPRQQELLDAKKSLADLQTQLTASQHRGDELDQRWTKALHDKEAIEGQWRDAVDKEKNEVALWKARWEQEEQQRRSLSEQLDRSQREASDQSRHMESLTVLQDTLERQTKYAKQTEDKLQELAAKLSESAARVASATRQAQQKDLEIQSLKAQLSTMTSEVETQQTLVHALQTQAHEVHTKTQALKRSEDDVERQRRQLEKDKHALERELADQSELVDSTQRQLEKTQDELAAAVAAHKLEMQAVQSELRQVRTQEILPLVRQREQLQGDTERLRDKLAGMDKVLRQCEQDRTQGASRIDQLEVALEAWKRKEQQQKTHKEAYLQAKTSMETQLQSLQAETSAFQHDKRVEVEKMVFRLRELESHVAQKDYEIVRMEERFTTAEAWRLKEARRVEERDVALLALKEELVQTKSRNVDAENNLIVHEMRRERDQLQTQVRSLSQELEDERVAQHVAQHKHEEALAQVHHGLECQLPQLAAACVSRSSEEWTRKCHEMVAAVRDEWAMKALQERNSLRESIKESEERRTVAEHKLQHAVGECEFLRKEVHRVEDNNKVLLDQLHTIRVYLTQRAGIGGFMAATMATGGGGRQPSPFTTPASVPVPDDAAVNQLNAQLSVLHSQFQQLFDAHATRPPTYRQYSPRERFEIPSSPRSRKDHQRASDTGDLSTSSSSSSSSSTSSSSALDQTLDKLLQENKAMKGGGGGLTHEKEQLLQSLESLGTTSARITTSSAPSSHYAAVAPLVSSTGGAPSSTDSMWYQKHYWRAKYQA